MTFSSFVVPIAIISDTVAWFRANPIGSGFTVLSFAVLVFLYVRNRVRIKKFWDEVKIELGKCSWPWDPQQTGLRRYKELVDSSILVMVSMFLLGVYTGFFDFLLSRATGFITQLGV